MSSTHHHHHSHRKHRHKRKLSRKVISLILLGSVLVCALCGFFIMRSLSFSTSLRRIGLDSGNAHVLVQNAYDVEGKEFMVVQSTSGTTNTALAIVSKSKLGFWSVSAHQVGNTGVANSLLSLSWIQPGSSKTFDRNTPTVFSNEQHIIYCGNNAIKLIEIAPKQIPHNVTVKIHQDGKNYWLHVISFADEQIVSGFNVESILRENGCIS